MFLGDLILHMNKKSPKGSVNVKKWLKIQNFQENKEIKKDWEIYSKDHTRHEIF